jgi:hypothetical protein
MADYDKVIMSNNNISCAGNASTGCRGFVVQKTYSLDRSGTMDFTINGNYWTGKTLISSANIATPSYIYTADSDIGASLPSTINIFLFSPDCTLGYGNCPAGDMNISWIFDTYTTVGSPIAGAGYQ